MSSNEEEVLTAGTAYGYDEGSHDHSPPRRFDDATATDRFFFKERVGTDSDVPERAGKGRGETYVRIFRINYSSWVESFC